MIYPTLKKILFRFDAETVHDSVLQRLELFQQTRTGRRLLRMLGGGIQQQPSERMGILFPHPVGVAAGFDKDARVVLALQELGFGFIEVGTVTPRPQTGNPKPRIWRFPEARALVNALGFPGEGMERVRKRLHRLRTTGLLKVPLGINLGKNSDTPVERAADDYAAVLDSLHEFGDYFVVNVSSPNTAGLRNLQAVSSLEPILSRMLATNAKHGEKPILVKIAPDLADEDLLAIARLARRMRLAGMVAGNTTVQRDLVPRAATLERGGLSGAPLYPRTKKMIALVRSELDPSQVVIAVGGISTAEQLKELRALGADLVQVYTAFIYHGPRCVKTILKGGTNE